MYSHPQPLRLHGSHGPGRVIPSWRRGGCCCSPLLRLTALQVGIRDPVAILTRWAIGLDRAELAALVVTTCEVGADGARRAFARTAGRVTPTVIAVIATATNGHDKHQCRKYREPPHDVFLLIGQTARYMRHRPLLASRIPGLAVAGRRG